MIIPDIIEQHWEEAGILWGLRSAATMKASFSLKTLKDLDERVEAHLDGLRTASAEGWELIMRVATWEDPGEGFAAGVLSFETSDERRIGEVVKQATANPALVRGLISALGWLDASVAQRMIQHFLASASGLERRIGVGAAAIHRLRINGSLSAALKDSDECVRARACRAAGELGRVDLLGLVQANLAGNSEPAVFWSAWSSALLAGDASGLERLREFLERPSEWQARAANILFRHLKPAAAAELGRALMRKAEHARLAVIGAGIQGDPASIPWLLEQMSNPELQRLAADAFQTVTGADFVMDRLRNGAPPRPSVPEDSGADASADPDEDLTWPAPKAIRQWWTERREKFSPGARYLLGKPLTNEWLHEVLVLGQQHQRTGAALELAIRTPGSPLFEVRAPGFRQEEMLTKFKGLRQDSSK
jgi:uncharacterized protein (TIGR02270 family)